MPRIAQSHFRGVRPADHYMHLQMLTIEHLMLPTVPVISRQVIPYWTCGGTCSPGLSTL
jgi:hypothetical protein